MFDVIMIKSSLLGSLNRAILLKKKRETSLRHLLCSRLEMGFYCVIMKEKMLQRKMIV